MMRRTISVAALVVALGGTAVAANGKPALLGHTNHATKTTTLRDAKGTPLTLVAGKGKPPLSVSGDATQVPSLDASLLGGLPASSYGRVVRVFAVPGTATFTVPAGMHQLLVTVVGGGGGGAGKDSEGNTGGAGGQGGLATAVVTVTPGAEFVAVIGAGGTAGPVSGAGGSGGTSLLRDSGSTAGAFAVEALGGGGGGVGEVCAVATDGAGGAVAGPTATFASTAAGIRSVPGAPGTSQGSDCPNFTVPGGSPGVAGGGGGGADSAADAAGAAGQPGCVVVEFFA